jgi:hypothetical protein
MNRIFFIKTPPPPPLNGRSRMFVGEIFYYYIFIQFLEVTTLPPLGGVRRGSAL